MQHYRRSELSRRLHHWGHEASEALLFLAPTLLDLRPRMWVWPTLPIRWLRRLKSPASAWKDQIAPPPEELTTVSGIRKIAVAQAAAYDEEPLHDFFHLHETARKPLAPMWVSMVSIAPRIQRAERRRLKAPLRKHDSGRPRPNDPATLTREFKEFADEIGLSAVGVTAYDVKYSFVEYHGREAGQTIVVGVLEQNYDATQWIPSIRSERGALATYPQLEDRMLRLGEWLRDRGYAARPEGYVGESMFIAYAVEAGLGQLGLNGQLLTPHAGSRVRLHVMSTDAPLLHDAPVDYGIEGVCDVCQICVRRCPVGAIPAQRKEHRGIVKAKINTKRCLPIVGRAAGCSICMKVCPVQRYGLKAVIEEYKRSGRILGKGSDDLEGFDWPLDGRRYGPGQKPRIPAEVTSPAGFHFDPARIRPQAQDHRPSEPMGY